MYRKKISPYFTSLYFAVLFCISIPYAHAQSKEEVKLTRNKLAKTSKNTIEKAELLLDVSRIILFKEGELKTDIDSAIVLNNQARAVSKNLDYKLGIGKSLLLEAQITKEKGDQKKAWDLAKSALAYAKKNNMPELQADIYAELGHHFGNEKEELLQKIKYYELAVPLYQKGKALKKEGDALKELGDFYEFMGETQKAATLFDKAVAIYKSVGYKQLQGIYTLMSGNYRTMGNFQSALQYALMAENIAEEVNDQSFQLSTIYNHLALAYYDLKKNDLALSYFEKSLNIALKYKNVDAVNTISTNLASLHYRKKNFRETLRIIKLTAKDYPPTDSGSKLRQTFMFLVSYSMLKEFDNAKPYYEKMLRHYHDNKEAEVGLDYKLMGIILYLQQSGQAEKTYLYLDELKDYCKKTNNIIRLSELEGMYFKSDSACKKYLPAIEHIKQYKILSDSVFNLDRAQQFSALQLKFETEKKDKNIKLLTQQAKLQETKIYNDMIIRYVFIGSLVVLVLFLGLIYNRYRLKQKTNQRLESKQEKINQQNELLKKLLTEKEWLLKEIHHRVKNNLQIVISLLNTQSAYLDNKDALLAIQNSQHRMHAMSLIHQKLYQSENLAYIDISWYIYELVNYLKESFDMDRKISYTLDTEKLELDVAQAVPLGLILNEAVSNAIKYAFPDKKKGNIFISLKNIEGCCYQLIIADDGVGLPEGFDLANSESLGMNLMMGLSDQLDGSFKTENNNGLKITIEFIKKNQLMDDSDNSMN